MSLEARTEGETLPSLPAIATGGKAPPKYPVAKPARKIPRIKGGPEPEEPDLVEDLLSPPSIKSFAVSFAAHALLLLVLAFWYFAPPTQALKVFDTTLAGSEFGDESSDQLKGGLGMDTPVSLPEEAPAAPASALATITSLPVAELTPVERASDRPRTTGAGAGAADIGAGAQAGNGDGFGVAKFGHGGENINGVDVKVGDPQFTLIWDSRGDLDLHVVEPGGSEIYWENRNGGQGGELDVDDIDGFGPENINYVQGKGPPGTYRWFVHYYGGLGGLAQNTRWRVRVKFGGKVEVVQGKFGAIGQKSRIYELKVAADTARSATAPPSNPTELPEGGRVVLTPPSAAPAAPPAAAPSGPVAFAPPGAGFSVTLPSEPKAGRKDWDTPLGPVVAQVYGLDQVEGGFSLATLDFPAASIAKADPSKLLDDLAAKAVSESKGTSTRQAKIALSGSAGREVEFTVPDAIVGGGGLGRSRVYLAGSRALILTALGTRAFLNSPETDAVFKSFKLVDSR